MSWKPEVKIEGKDHWTTNGICFETEREAREYAFDLAMRWIGVDETRAVRSDDAVTHMFVDGKLLEVRP